MCVEASLPARLGMTTAELNAATICTRRTPTQLGLVARGDTPAAALQAASLALDALSGQDLFAAAIDWPVVEAALALAPARIGQRREYRFGAGDDTFLAILADEARLHGLCLAVANGLITMVRLANFADTEDVVASITEDDILTDAQGRELPVKVKDSGDPLATSVSFEIPGEGTATRTVTVTDTTYEGEFAAGATVECKALRFLPPDAVEPGLEAALVDVAVQLLGPLAEPNREIALPLAPTHMALQAGDKVRFTHSRIPTWGGARGFVDAVCQVQDVRRGIFGGALRCSVTLRLQSGDRFGYAPAALVQPGFLLDSSPIVTLDISSDFGPACFAPAVVSGVANTDPAYGFAVGHKVRLSQFARAPIASELFTIVAIDRAGHTITLDGNPSSAMVTASNTAYGVSIRFASYGAVELDQQRRWAWVADETTRLLDGTDAPKRWAA